MLGLDIVMADPQCQGGFDHLLRNRIREFRRLRQPGQDAARHAARIGVQQRRDAGAGKQPANTSLSESASLRSRRSASSSPLRSGVHHRAPGRIGYAIRLGGTRNLHAGFPVCWVAYGHSDIEHCRESGGFLYAHRLRALSCSSFIVVSFRFCSRSDGLSRDREQLLLASRIHERVAPLSIARPDCCFLFHHAPARP